MKNFLVVFIFLAFAIIQISLGPVFNLWGIWPNFILILTIILIMNNADEYGWLLAGIGGLVMDLASPMFFGLYTMIFLAVALINGFFIKKNISEISWIIISILSCLNTLLFDLIIMTVSKEWFWYSWLTNGGLGLVWGAIIFAAVSYFNRSNQILKIT